MPPKSSVAGNSPTGGGNQIPKTRTLKVPQKSKVRAFIEQHYVSFIVFITNLLIIRKNYTLDFISLRGVFLIIY